MAVIFNVAAQTSIDEGAHPTFALTSGGSDKVLLVGIAGTRGGGGAFPSVTYNGVGMTKVGEITDGGNSNFAEIWRLIAPADGAHNVVITSNVNAYARAFAALFNGVNQTTPIANTNSFQSNFPAYPQNTSISTPTGGIAVDIAAYMDVGSGAHINPVTQNQATAIITNTNAWWGCAGGARKAGATQLGWNANTNGSSTVVFLDFLVSLNQSSGATVPGAPTIGTATAGNGNVTAHFTPPGSDGGSAITGYMAVTSTGPSQAGASSPIVVSGMTLDVPVTIHVYAINAIGNSANSAESNSVTPTAPASGPRYRANMGGNL